jgi:formylglycine-generating enzyme required for sulfatase activity
MKVFISYAIEDQDTAAMLEELLQRDGAIVYRDKSSMRFGHNWREEMFPLVCKCDYFLLLWSFHSSKSRFILEEINEALKHDRNILPCLLDLTPIIPQLEDIRRLDLNDLHKGYIHLKQSLDLDSNQAQSSEEQTFRQAIYTYRIFLRRAFERFQVLYPGNEAPTKDLYIPLAFYTSLRQDEDDIVIEPQDILQAILQYEGNVVIAGHPGSGKTSTLHFIVYSWSQLESDVFLIFAKCKHYRPAIYQSFEDYLRASLLAKLPPSLIAPFSSTNIFANSPCLILLDGMDELTASGFEEFKRHLDEFLTKYPKCQIVITTRIDGYRGKLEDNFLGWHTLAIAPFDDKRISKFVRRWFADSDKAASLLLMLQENHRLYDLGRRPFLLSLMCLIFQQDGSLGANRSDLYKRAAHYLEERRQTKTTSMVINLRHAVLKEVALRSLQMGSVEIESRICAAITDNILEAYGITAYTAVDFLDNIVTEVGILQTAGKDLAFIHRTFQEYYTALALSDMPNGRDLLLDHCHVASWEEPVRLYAGGLSSVREQEDFVSELWRRYPALAMRTSTECEYLAPTFLGSLLKDSPIEDRVRIINDIRASLRAFEADKARDIVIETLAPLFANESDSSVLYFGIQLLLQFDPQDSGHILHKTFYAQAEHIYEHLSADPKYKFEFVQIPSGTFYMGDDHSFDEIERPTHEVSVGSFDIGKYQLTNLAYEYIMGRSPEERSVYSSGDDYPVVNLSWYDAYICALKAGCRLPTEAEWEYAARAGSQSQWFFGDDETLLIKFANYEDNKVVQGAWAVGTGSPNNWGLHDVHGNVWEWCNDWLAPYSASKQRNPKGPDIGTTRVRRGGGHAYHARGCRSAFRWGNDPNYRFKDIGVRLARDIVR